MYYIYIYTYIYTYIHIHTYTRKHTHTHIYIYLSSIHENLDHPVRAGSVSDLNSTGFRCHRDLQVVNALCQHRFGEGVRVDEVFAGQEAAKGATGMDRRDEGCGYLSSG